MMQRHTSGARMRAVRAGWLASAVWCVVAVGCGGNGETASPSTADRSGGGGLIAKSPQDRSKVLVKEAEEAVRRGDRETALADFRRAIEINPRETSAFMGMGDLFRTEKDWGRAQELYERAASTDPRNFDAQYLNGLMLQMMERVSEAISAYLLALNLKPDDFKANLNLSAAYYQLDENSQALQYGRKAVQLQPRNGPARFNLGAIYAAMNLHQEAVQEYQQAAELMELTPSLLLNLAESYGRLRRFEEMRNTLIQLAESDPSGAVWERLGYVAFQLGKYDEALTAFEKSVAMAPDYTPGLNGVGVSYLNAWIKSDYKNATAHQKGIAALKKSLQVSPNQPKILELVTRYTNR
ncbi:MAG: tetratricopeptide repeat protein [Phycisphaeraceae bacterium]|nr:tetratricopeptide repeat protein [Phycisphaeraceae bacterium]